MQMNFNQTNAVDGGEKEKETPKKNQGTHGRNTGTDTQQSDEG